MKSFCIFGVFLLLSVVELEATSVSESSCPKRNLTVTGDDQLRLYIDGVEITGLPNNGDIRYPDVVDLPCTTRLIAIHGKQRLLDSPAANLASTDDNYVLTNSTWKCSNVSHVAWEEIDFDDSAWMSAIEFGQNGDDDWAFMPNISLKASRIWLRQYISDQEEMDVDVYCRKKLVTSNCASVQYLNDGICLNGINYNVCVCSPEWTGVNCDILISACDSNPCLNGGTCSDLDGDSFACTCPVYWTGVRCESPNYIESLTCGTTLQWANYSASNGFTRLCIFWAPLSDPVGRATECRNTMTGIPLYDNSTGLMENGGNFGCIVSQDYPNDLEATSYLSCADDYQQDVALGNFTELDRLMVCIRYPYEGVPVISACDSNPCLNGGTCSDLDGDSFACTCPVYWTGVRCESPNYVESLTCGTTLQWANYSASNGFTRLCIFWAPLSDSVGRATECRNMITGIPLYDNSTGLMENGGNFGCIVSQNYPDDLPATSALSCANNYQQDLSLGNFIESAHLMVCIRYPYDGLPESSICLSSPCAFGGICIEEPNGGYQCICAPGYTGQNCSDEINYCDSDPCANGGSCEPTVTGYVCQCPPGYTGDHCQHDNTCSECQSFADIAIAMSVLLAVSLAVNITILITWLCNNFRAKKANSDPFTNPENVLPTEITNLSNVSSVPSPYEELRRPDESQLHQNNYEKLTPTISPTNDE